MLIQLLSIEVSNLIKYLTVKEGLSMAKIRITQTHSKIGSPLRQKATLEALGLRKVNSSVEVEATPQILGMVTKVRHLVTVEEL